MAQKTLTAFTKTQKRTYIREVLAPRLIFTKRTSILSDKLREYCMGFLTELVAKEPEIPKDWSRPVPQTSDYKKQWDILRAFLESPTITVFDYREKKEERRMMENAIASVQIDLTTQTIRKGSPHTLRLINNQDAYKKKWRSGNRTSTY